MIDCLRHLQTRDLGNSVVILVEHDEEAIKARTTIHI